MSNKAKKKSKLKLILWSLVIIVAAFAIARPMLAPKNVGTKEIIPARGNLTTYYSFSGSVEAKNRETVFASKAMQVKDIKVEEGQIISKDDVLMTTAFGEKITAKIDGEVSKIYAEENAQLMPGGKLIEIVDYSDLQIIVKVDEYDLPSISKGKEAVVTIHSLAKDVKGTIAEVSKEGTYLNGVTFFTASIALESDSDIKVGMSAEAKILDKSVQNTLLIPVSAINFDANNKAFVNVKSDKGTRTAALEIGLTDGINAEVLNGISERDIVVIPAAEKSGFTPPFARQGNQENDSSPEEK